LKFFQHRNIFFPKGVALVLGMPLIVNDDTVAI